MLARRSHRNKGRWSPSVNDRVRIEDGPAQGLVGDVISVDVGVGLAQVRVWVPGPWGQLRPGVAVVGLRHLRRAARDASDVVAEPVVRPSRGRPRTISDETVEKIRRLYETGIYSHQEIASSVGVSKSSVTHYLRSRPPST